MILIWWKKWAPNVTVIGKGAFYSKSKIKDIIKKIELPNGITDINKDGFKI